MKDAWNSPGCALRHVVSDELMDLFLRYPLRSSYQTATFHDSCICLDFCLAGSSMVASHYCCHYSCCSAFSLAVFYHDSPYRHSDRH